MNDTAIFKDLAAKLGVPDSERFMKILVATFTPEEAHICHELFEPATCAELAGRLEAEEAHLTEVLNRLVDRGILTRGRTQYGFHNSLIAFHHDTVADVAPHTGPNAIPQKVKELWADFFRHEWSYMFLEHTAQMVEKTGRNLPIWPAIGALEKSPNISPDDLLPEENWKLRIENAKNRIIAPCGCRIVWGTCDHPIMTCFATFDRPRGEYYMNQPGRLLKIYTLAETLDIVRESEESGLVHWGDCYCCDDCCENLFPIKRSGRYDLMTPNRFLAVVDEDKCKGCQDCIEKCPFEAVELRKSDSSKKFKAYIVPEKCKGCGLCIVGCKHDAITYRIVRPPEYIAGKSTSVVNEPGKPARTLPNFGFYELQ